MGARETLGHECAECERRMNFAEVEYVRTKDERAYDIALEKYKSARIAAFERYDWQCMALMWRDCQVASRGHTDALPHDLPRAH